MPLILCTPDTGTVLCIFLVHKQSFVLSAGPLHNTAVPVSVLAMFGRDQCCEQGPRRPAVMSQSCRALGENLRRARGRGKDQAESVGEGLLDRIPHRVHSRACIAHNLLHARDLPVIATATASVHEKAHADNA